MGRYLVLGGRENNSKSISYLMGDIIRDIVGKENLHGDWCLDDKDLAKLIIVTKSLLDDENKLIVYKQKHCNSYWSEVDSILEIKDNLQWILNCLSEVVSDYILNKELGVFACWE